MTINDTLGRSTMEEAGPAVLAEPPIPSQEVQDPQLPTKSRYAQEPIAVIGMGCRLPGHSNSPHALWEFLLRGGIAGNEPPASRFRLATHHDGSKKPKTMRSPGGMFLEDVDPARFDAAFFGVGKMDAVAMDPQQRQLLAVVYETLENAGVPLDRLDGRAVGCFVGSYAVDYADMQARDPDDRAPSVTVGVGRAILSNRISHFLNIHGPSMTIDTACSGSLVGLDVACRYLSSGEIEGALVAGANLYLSPEHNQDSGPMKGASSLSGRCHTFDKKADGYIKAEAINCVMLKRLADAERDGDPIRAIIRGTATNSDGRTPGIASPSAEAQAMAVRAAYANAGIADLAVTGYVEMHGTGTQAGDPQEVKGLASVFAGARPADAPPLLVGSIKSNVGHSEPAAGISGLMKAVMAVENGQIPGNPTFVDPNPNIDFEASRVRASRYTIPWPTWKPSKAQPCPNGNGNGNGNGNSEGPASGALLRRAGVNSFGYGGSNAHVIVDQVPPHRKNFISSFRAGGLDLDLDDLLPHDMDMDPERERPQVLLFSANDGPSLGAYTESLRRHLLDPRVQVNLSDLAYTLSERRTRLFHRGFAIANSSGTASAPSVSATSLAADALTLGKRQPERPRIGFVFTGQGAQWSQMGKALLANFSEARAAVVRLDGVLQNLPHPPKWSLLTELTEARSPETLRKPEFSQPLVTAVQMGILAVLDGWGVRAEAVVGHSSGEIAAAFAAGLLSEADAITAAYYRGYASTVTQAQSQGQSQGQNGQNGGAPRKVGMMAVGLGGDEVREYMARAAVPDVTIACFNSPSSVTLSGSADALEAVRTLLVADRHFARMLQVDMAYHSPFMAAAGDEYVRNLEAANFGCTSSKTKSTRGRPKMYSSVEGDHTDRPVDIDYWKSNMVQPVLFDQALRQMLLGQAAPDFVVEIGPSGALAGPISQVKKALPAGSAAGARGSQYCSALTRGKDAGKAIFDVAGRLFVAGYEDIDFTAVNRSSSKPSLVMDLPNYAWNHTNTYWYESEASRDWRYREFPHHDLLGSKVLGTPWQAPAWKKTLHVEDLPWLKDHRLGPDVVFPGAGYMCMAVEAVLQTDAVLRAQEAGEASPRDIATHACQVRLRDVTFDRALVLEEGKDARIMLTLAPVSPGQKHSWYSWTVRSLVGESWVDHCKGRVRVEEDPAIMAPSSDDASTPLQHEVPGALWYKPMRDVGYGFGPVFRKLRAVEATSGSRKCRARLDLQPPPSAYPQSVYPLHPAVLDGCMQSCAPGLWRGIRSSVNAVLVPAVIDDLVVRAGGPTATATATAVSESVFAGPGRTDLTTNYSSNTRVYVNDPNTAEPPQLILKLTGLRYHELDFNESPHAAHKYSRLTWAPDVSLTPQGACEAAVKGLPDDSNGWAQVQAVADLVAHKKPNASVVEMSLVPGDASSFWLDGIVAAESKPRNAYASYRYLALGSGDVVAAQTKYEGVPRTSFHLVDDGTGLEQRADLVILRLPAHYANDGAVKSAINKVGSMLREDGHLLVLEQSVVREAEGTVNGTNGHNASTSTSLLPQGFETLYAFACANSASLSLICALLAAPARSLSNGHASPPTPPPALDLVHFKPPGATCTKIKDLLVTRGWDARDLELKAVEHIRRDAAVLVITELEDPVLPSLDAAQWTALQALLQMRSNKIVWVSRSAQWRVTNPDGAMIHGLCRTVRTEDPSMSVTTLDVEDPGNKNANAVAAIDLVLRAASSAPLSDGQSVEGEYVERGGTLYVSRILGDDAMNAAAAATTAPAGIPPVETSLHDAKTTVRLVAERVGSIDSLHYVEVNHPEDCDLPLPDNKVEVELFASALNFKDVAVTMGIVPEDARLLGLEGAGTIRRVGKNLGSPSHMGQRVLVFEKGTFANRIVATTERTIPIPDWLSFEDAATLPSVYLTALHSLFNLSGLQAGHTVLIHSASGGLGIAAIQICQAVGAHVFATVGQDRKAEFLTETFGIPRAHIFNSRTAEFEGELMDCTGGRGVDVILNSLTGDLLEASWRCIAEGGTMVELGKKDHIDRNSLSMAPFARNASYRCFDMSHKHVTDQVIAVLMKQMMDMITCRTVKPISPIKLFPYSDIASAMRFMRSANHIGKIIISDKALTTGGPDTTTPPAVPVPVRPLPRTLRLRSDVSYLIVGGLKGLCGSLAVHMARHGARFLVILSRSGADDARSQAVLKDLAAEGCHADLAQGDVSNIDDVRAAFALASRPVAGVVQGAMVLRDKPFEMMTHEEYTAAITAKVAGTWNLHRAARELETKNSRPLDFFTLLSSVSGLVGQPAQANYAAANVFLDSFAHYRRGLGLRANSVSLGAIEDVGYMAEHSELFAGLDVAAAWTPINERLFHTTVGFSILQQHQSPLNAASQAQLITSVAVPQPPTSRLLRDARFTSLVFGGSDAAAVGQAGGGDGGSNKDTQALKLMLSSMGSGKAGDAEKQPEKDAAAALALAVDVANKQFMKTLRLDEPLEPAKPLSAYGLDSLAAVEFRNLVRAQLGAELTTLDVTGAPSLLGLAEKIVSKMRAAGGGAGKV